jgi:hypothetical protein
MRHFHRLLFALLLLPLLAGAATKVPPNLQELPEPPPPPPGYTDDQPADTQPDIVIKKKGEDTVEEYSIHGQVYMVKVTPPHGIPYYLVKKTIDGGWSRLDGQAGNIAIPQWVIFTF